MRLTAGRFNDIGVVEADDDDGIEVAHAIAHAAFGATVIGLGEGGNDPSLPLP